MLRQSLHTPRHMWLQIFMYLHYNVLDCCCSIGFAIARRLAQEGAKVVISSRKQDNVDEAVQALKKENLDAYGVVCHVKKAEDRKRLLDEVITLGLVPVSYGNLAVQIIMPTLERCPLMKENIKCIHGTRSGTMCLP